MRIQIITCDKCKNKVIGYDVRTLKCVYGADILETNLCKECFGALRSYFQREGGT